MTKRRTDETAELRARVAALEAALNEVAAQRDFALQRCATLAAELGRARAPAAEGAGNGANERNRGA